jgi:hypothetical protein
MSYHAGERVAFTRDGKRFEGEITYAAEPVALDGSQTAYVVRVADEAGERLMGITHTEVVEEDALADAGASEVLNEEPVEEPVEPSTEG